jgi:hypothetical protein
MSILPFENFTINTNLTPEEVKTKLSEFVGTPQVFRNPFKRPNEPYSGTIQDESFKITRNINYRNSFLPVITGKINDNYPTGSTINITMSLNPFVIAFMSLWLFVVAGVGLTFFIAMITTGELIVGGLIPFGMLIFGCLLTIIPFKIEANIAKKFLEELF